MSGDESKKKLRREIIIVVVIALVIVAVSAVFISDYIIKSKREEKISAQVNEEMNKKLEENRIKASEIGDNRNLDLVGRYVSGGDPNSTTEEGTYVTIQLSSDGTASAQTLAGTTVAGWWASDKKGSAELVAIGFEKASEPKVYQIFNNHLIDMNSLYFGHVYNKEAFDTTLVSAHETGTMTINLTSNKKAKAEFEDTNKESENYGLKYAYSGSYRVDGEFIDIELNGAQTRFVMFDYKINDSDTDSGIASIFYTKVE